MPVTSIRLVPGVDAAGRPAVFGTPLWLLDTIGQSFAMVTP